MSRGSYVTPTQEICGCVFHLENFLTSSMYGLIFMILGHGGSLKGKSGQILEYQASQLAISILILLSSHCHFDILREGTKKDYLIPKLLDQA